MAVELLHSMICLNMTCDAFINDPSIDQTYFYDLNETDSSLTVKQRYLKFLQDSLNGQVLRVTTLYDPPLSWTENVNGTLVGKGIAFQLFNILMEKFNFTYELVMPKINVMGSTRDVGGTLLELLKNGVSSK